MGLAEHRHALVWLAGIAFIESFIFPIPTAVMLIPMVLATPQRAWKLAGIATVCSVAGGWIGYGIGAFLFDSFGQKIITLYHLEAGYAHFVELFRHYGGWVVLAKGLTPIPFKLVTIASGALGLDPLVFTLSALGSRATQFFLVAGLLHFFGPPIKNFIEQRLLLVTSAALLVIVGGFLLLRWL